MAGVAITDSGANASATAGSDAAKSIEVMYPLSIESRLQDRDVMSILRDASQKTPQGAEFGDRLKMELARIDGVDKKAIEAFGGKRVTFQALDGFTVGAIVVPSMRRTGRAAVVLLDGEELPDSYDSLATGMAAAGYRAFDRGVLSEDASPELRWPQLVDHAYELPRHVPAVIGELIVACLDQDPQRRPTPDAVAELVGPALAALPKPRLSGFKVS